MHAVNFTVLVSWCNSAQVDQQPFSSQLGISHNENGCWYWPDQLSHTLHTEFNTLHLPHSSMPAYGTDSGWYIWARQDIKAHQIYPSFNSLWMGLLQSNFKLTSGTWKGMYKWILYYCHLFGTSHCFQVIYAGIRAVAYLASATTGRIHVPKEHVLYLQWPEDIKHHTLTPFRNDPWIRVGVEICPFLPTF